MNVLEFKADSFREQGFRFAKLTEKTWNVEVLESWSSLGETWVSIGRVMESKPNKDYYRWRDIGCWSALSGPFARIGLKTRAEAARELEKMRYGQN